MSATPLWSFERHHLCACSVHRTWAWSLKYTQKNPLQSKEVVVASHKSELWLTLCIIEKHVEIVFRDKELHVILWDNKIHHTLGSCVWPEVMLSGAGWWILLPLSYCSTHTPMYWGLLCVVFLFLLHMMGVLWGCALAAGVKGLLHLSLYVFLLAQQLPSPLTKPKSPAVLWWSEGVQSASFQGQGCLNQLTHQYHIDCTSII